MIAPWLWQWARQRHGEIDVTRSAADLAAALRLSQIANLELEPFLAAAEVGAVPRSVVDANLKLFFRETLLHRPFRIATRQWEAEYDYHDPLFCAISLSDAAQSVDQILETASQDGEVNPYVRMMPALYDRAAGAEKPDLVGISVTAVNQVIPAFVLARWLKSRFAGTRVLLGGAWGTHLLDRPEALRRLFDCVDGIVAGDGEQPLLEAVRRTEAGAPWTDIPGLFVRAPEGVSANAGDRWDAPLDDLPTPDFAGLPLDQYDYPGLLPLQASRGCSWGKCTFCSYVTLDPVYRVRSVDKVASDIEALARLYPLREIAFTDSLMQPKIFSRLADEIIRRGLRVKWRGFGRFDRRFSSDVLDLMARAGCHFIIWGMESASQPVLKAMRKGNTPGIIHQNLRDAARAGIHNRACLIYGYPTETREDRDLTISFLRDRKDWVHSIAFCRYTAIRDTPMTREAEPSPAGCTGRGESLALEVPQESLDAGYLCETEQLLRALWLEVERHRRPRAGNPAEAIARAGTNGEARRW